MRRVLIVDDDSGIRELLRMILEDDGYQVETANDGVEAWERLSESRDVWVVLLDITMPHMTGTELCARLTAMGGSAARHMVVLMTAGYFPDDNMPPPVRALLPKPFELQLVRELVDELSVRDPEDGDESVLQILLSRGSVPHTTRSHAA